MILKQTAYPGRFFISRSPYRKRANCAPGETPLLNSSRQTGKSQDERFDFDDAGPFSLNRFQFARTDFSN